MQEDNYPCVCKFQHTVQGLLTELNNTHQISAGILDKHKQYWLYKYQYALVEASFDALYCKKLLLNLFKKVRQKYINYQFIFKETIKILCNFLTVYHSLFRFRFERQGLFYK